MAASAGRPGPPISSDLPACAYVETVLDCFRCGACCRQAFDAVPVEAADRAIARVHPELVVDSVFEGHEVRRVPDPLPDRPHATRCAALEGTGSAGSRFRCRIYAERPLACRDLAVGSESCLLARRRVGLAPRVAPLGPER